MPQPTEFRVMVSPLSKRAYAGRVRIKSGFAESAGVRHDVTSDLWAAAIHIIGPGNTHVITADGEPAYEITIRDVRTGKGESRG